ncbi:MAG: L-fuculose-phosphate aldolase [Anaerolineaceae bacterium]|nr:L-fuculose-phosphate aldolase [Anaerolineaceae bacterium]
MLLINEREQVIRFGIKMIESGLTTGSGGNISILNAEKGLAAISPSGMEYKSIKLEDVVIMDLDGNIVEGTKTPSSEASFHLALLKHREDINAVVHTHSVFATTIACLNWELPAVHYLVGFSGDKVPLAPYATFGSQELADHIIQNIGEYNGILLANHGLVTVGNNIETAFAAAEEIELVSQIYYQAKSIGEPVILSNNDMQTVLKKFKSYGQKGKKE